MPKRLPTRLPEFLATSRAYLRVLRQKLANKVLRCAIGSLFLALLWLPGVVQAQEDVAVYSVVFESTWSQATHPHPAGADQFPANAHFSPLIGATHNLSVTFWAESALATPGVEQMAETGGVTLLSGEIAAAGNFMRELLSGPGMATSPGAAAIPLFSASRDHPLVTLVSMIAPSPDWFVGVTKLSLLDDSNQWKETLTVQLYPYDAGTDDGVDYRSPDNEPAAHHPIANINSQSPFSAAPIGAFTFTHLKQIYLPVVLNGAPQKSH